MDAIVRALDTDFMDFADLALVSRVGMENVLVGYPNAFDPGEATALRGQIHHEALQRGARLVVLDSLHDLFAANENNRPASSSRNSVPSPWRSTARSG
jgi:hypothetical protein